MEASAPTKQGDRAVIVNNQVSLAGDGCLRFWYHMYGSNVGNLAVYIDLPSTATQPVGVTPSILNDQSKLVWAQSGDKRDMWRNARVGVYVMLSLYGKPKSYIIVHDKNMVRMRRV